MTTLNNVEIKGFRSIKEMNLGLKPLNVVIGANGAGKSNLIAFFKLVNELMGGRLQQHVGATGGATGNLHFGPGVTPQLEARLVFEVENGTDTYHMRLFHAAGDALIFAEETAAFHQEGYPSPKIVQLGVGHLETKIGEVAETGEPTAKTLRVLLNRCRVYHFHNTSPTSRVRQYGYMGDNRWLKPDAGNLAAILYALKLSGEADYQRIVTTIRQVAPFFEDFDLEPADTRDIILNWRHRESDLVFGPHQLSDGTLRAMCLISLLLQPAEKLPSLIVVDEPELGLDPCAVDVIASLFRSVSQHAQVLVSTQSSAFVDSFEADDIVVVERNNETTEFKRTQAEDLDSWVEKYAHGEFWERDSVSEGTD